MVTENEEKSLSLNNAAANHKPSAVAIKALDLGSRKPEMSDGPL